MPHCMRLTFVVVAVAISLVPLSAIAQPTQTSTESATYTAQFISVGDGVELEVLDWGGTGRILVLLAGLGNTARVFEGFAPKLTDSHRVIGITRRGHGQSAAPSDGYDADGLADDVLAVLNALDLDEPVLVGHSIASEEMSSLAARYPTRLGGLVYLDAAYDRTLPEFASIQEIASRLGQVGEPTGVGAAVMQGIKKPNYSAIGVPALSIYAAPASSTDLPGYSEEHAETFGELHEVMTAFRRRSAGAFREGILDHRVVELMNAHHFVFLSHEEDVLAELRQFVSSLP